MKTILHIYKQQKETYLLVEIGPRNWLFEINFSTQLYKSSVDTTPNIVYEATKSKETSSVLVSLNLTNLLSYSTNMITIEHCRHLIYPWIAKEPSPTIPQNKNIIFSFYAQYSIQDILSSISL